MTRIVNFERATFHQTHPDLTLKQVGTVAHDLYGFTPTVMPATLANVRSTVG